MLSAAGLPDSVVIVGGGAAGNAAAETLRQEGYAGPITLFSADASRPCDRPNLSKDYLAGSAEPDWISLRPPEFYTEHGIDLRLGVRVAAIDPAARTVALEDGSRISYGSLLLATGAEPIKLDVPGAALPHVHVLRTLADSDALIARAATAHAAWSSVRVSSVWKWRPRCEREVWRFMSSRPRHVRWSASSAPHSATWCADPRGARGALPPRRDGGCDRRRSVTLSTGEQLDADLVVVGIGVRPAVALAQQAGLAIDRGVVVDEFLQTSAPGIFAAGDIARWPDRLTGDEYPCGTLGGRRAPRPDRRRNMLGQRERFDAVPFFWSQHYDTIVAYVGHAEQLDRLEVDGDPAAHDCAGFWHEGKKLAVATVGRDRGSLEAEVAFEQAIGA